MNSHGWSLVRHGRLRRSRVPRPINDAGKRRTRVEGGARRARGPVNAADGHGEAMNSCRISPPVTTPLNTRSGAHNSWAGHHFGTAVGRPIKRRQFFGDPLASGAARLENSTRRVPFGCMRPLRDILPGSRISSIPLCRKEHCQNGRIRVADGVDAHSAHHRCHRAIRLGLDPGGAVLQA